MQGVNRRQSRISGLFVPSVALPAHLERTVIDQGWMFVPIRNARSEQGRKGRGWALSFGPGSSVSGHILTVVDK